MVSKEKELHKKTQELRNEYDEYLQHLYDKRKDFRIQRIMTGINNRFVQILMLNEIVHNKKKLTWFVNKHKTDK